VLTRNEDVLRHRADLLKKAIETVFVDSTGLIEDELRLDDLYYELALVEEQLNVMNNHVELLDDSFDDFDEDYFKLLRGDINEND
jgi:N-acetylglutamate synthase/N-acetylornithine aminotransferase